MVIIYIENANEKLNNEKIRNHWRVLVIKGNYNENIEKTVHFAYINSGLSIYLNPFNLASSNSEIIIIWHLFPISTTEL